MPLAVTPHSQNTDILSRHSKKLKVLLTLNLCASLPEAKGYAVPSAFVTSSKDNNVTERTSTFQ